MFFIIAAAHMLDLPGCLAKHCVFLNSNAVFPYLNTTTRYAELGDRKSLISL
jgi:hypothetical protein